MGNFNQHKYIQVIWCFTGGQRFTRVVASLHLFSFLSLHRWLECLLSLPPSCMTQWCSSEWNWLPTKINNAGWYIFHRSNNQLILRISVYPQLSRYGRAVRNHWSINEIIHRLCADAQWYKVSSVHCWYSAWVCVFLFTCAQVCCNSRRSAGGRGNQGQGRNEMRSCMGATGSVQYLHSWRKRRGD